LNPLENQIINDNEETTLKFIVQNEAIRTDDNKHISEESEVNDSTTATKLKKTRKKQTLDIDNSMLMMVNLDSTDSSSF
jgi:hypothetical protein